LPVENVLPNRLPKTATVPRRSNMSRPSILLFQSMVDPQIETFRKPWQDVSVFLIILPIAFVLITLCIYIILRGYLLIQRD